MIHSEFMTHRVFSRNAASSRAVPIDKAIEGVLTAGASPVFWGKNKEGMSATEEVEDIPAATAAWEEARQQAVKSVRALQATGLHKQIASRVLEPFQTMKVVVTATEWNNFFWLRDHYAAQPEIAALAKAMAEVYAESVPVHRDFHLPYVESVGDSLDYAVFTTLDGELLSSVSEAVKVSVSCCAQTSYRKSDYSLTKALSIYDKLSLESENPEARVHASPAEHVAFDAVSGAEGITHYKTGDDCPWSGNFRGWVQYRQLLNNHDKA
jgi:hypothetical protein